MIVPDWANSILVFCIWSSSSALVSIFAGDSNPVVVAGIVVALSLTIMSIPLIKRDKRHYFKEFEFYELSKLILPALLGMFLYPIFYFVGISGSSPIKANVLNYLWPLVAVVFDWAINKSKVKPLEGVSFSIAFVGAYIVMFWGRREVFEFDASEIKYEIVALLGALTYGFYTALIKRNIPQISRSSLKYDKTNSDKNNMTDYYRMYLMILLSFVMHVCIFLYFCLFDYDQVYHTITTLFIAGPKFFAMLFYSVVNFTLAHFLWNKINARNKTTYTSSMAYIIPFASTIILSKVSGVSISIAASIGLLLILISNIINNYNSINSINATIFGIFAFCMFDNIVPVFSSTEMKGTAKFFFQIIVSLFAIYYGFVLNRVVNDYNTFESTVDSLHIRKIGLSKELNSTLEMLEKQMINCARISSVKVYEDLSSHIDDYFAETSDYGDLIDLYYQLYRTCNNALSLSEWLIVILLSILIIILCFIVRENNIISTFITVVIGATIILCVSILYEYAARKRHLLETMTITSR